MLTHKTKIISEFFSWLCIFYLGDTEDSPLLFELHLCMDVVYHKAINFMISYYELSNNSYIVCLYIYSYI